MREEFLYYLWQFQRFRPEPLKTVCGQHLQILSPGILNHQSGPDFFNARMAIADQLWVGNVEIHLKASDWFAHQHEKDINYGNVILHAVWDYNAEVTGHDGIPIPTFCLRDYVAHDLLEIYYNHFLRLRHSFIACEQQLRNIPQTVVESWITRMYIEKLQLAEQRISKLALRVNHHWGHLLFLLLFKCFGGPVNGTVFLTAAERIPYKVIQGLTNNRLQLESMFFGMTGLLKQKDIEDPYYYLLRKEFKFLRYKYRLRPELMVSPEFFRIRPMNFPTIRLSQLASLFSERRNLFKELILSRDIKKVFKVLRANTSPYWHTHYVFGKTSEKKSKYVSKTFINMIIINVIIPLRCYYKLSNGRKDRDDEIEIMQRLNSEVNSVVAKFNTSGIKISSGLMSQGSLHLYTNYCLKRKCLHCAIGHQVLNGK